jgi:hypothetical protein
MSAYSTLRAACANHRGCKTCGIVLPSIDPTNIELVKRIEDLFIWLSQNNKGTAAECNLHEHLHAAVGCDECQVKWRR